MVRSFGKQSTGNPWTAGRTLLALAFAQKNGMSDKVNQRTMSGGGGTN